MKKHLLFITLTFFCIGVSAQDFRWAKTMGGTNQEEGKSIAVDSFGNVYTVGSFQGTVDFNPGAGTYNLTSSTGENIFISKLDSSGNFIWAKRIGGSGYNSAIAYGIALDATGNVYFTGRFRLTVDFDPGSGTFNLTATGADIFIAKLDSSGNFVWAKGMSGTNGGTATSVALDLSGNVYTTGWFTGTVDFDPGSGVYNLVASSSGAGFISKLDNSGNFVYAIKMIGTGGNSIAIDAVGNFYLAGGFMGTVDFDPGAGTFNLTAVNNYNMFILKLDSSGAFVWVKSFPGTFTYYTQERAIAVDKSGNVYTAGYFDGTVDFDPGAVTYNLTAAGGCDIFVSKLNSSGNFIWAKRMGGVSTVSGAWAMALDTSGNIYTTGSFRGTVDFDPGAGTYYLTASIEDLFISKLDASGNFVWARSMAGSNVEGESITVDPPGNIYTTGTYYGTTDFDPGSGTYNLTPTGSNDIFILKLAPCFPIYALTITGPSSVCVGATETYSINSISNATGYTWTVPPGAIIDSGQNTTMITVTFGTISGNIKVTPFNDCGIGTSKSFAVLLNPLPVAHFIADNSSQTFPIKGCTILDINLLDASINNDSVWYVIKKANDTYYQFSTLNFQLADTGWFDITQYASRKEGCMDSFTVKNAVFAAPKSTVQIFKDTIYKTCLQNYLRLKINYSYNDSVIIYWGDGSTDKILGLINGSNTDTMNHYYTNPGSFVIKALSKNEFCDTADFITHLVRPPLQMITANDTAICKGTFTSIWATANGGDSVFTYILKTPTVILQNISGLFLVSPDSTTTFIIGAINACAMDTLWKQITVTLRAPLALHLNTTDTTICKSNPFIITAMATGGNGNYHYLLKKNNIIQQDNTTGIFNITANNNEIYTIVLSDNCTIVNDSFTCKINIFNALQFTQTLPDLYLCPGEMTTLKTNTNNGSAVLSYLWTDPIGTILSTNDSLTLTPYFSTQIILKVTDACISIIDTNWIYTFANKSSTQLITDLPSGCVPLNIHFETPTLTYSNTLPYEASWDFGDGTTMMQDFNSTNATLKAIHTYIYSGIYKVQLKLKFKNNIKECYTFTTTIEALLIPQIKLNIAPKKITLPKTQCTAIITTINSDSVVIDWADGFNDNIYSNVSQITQTHDYADTGHYTVEATAYNKNTCYTKTQASVYHADTFLCFIPNAFTPNKDLTNETFIPVISFCKSYELTIYNRWGEVVYEASYKAGKAPQPTWSGEGNPAGTYIYLFTAFDGDEITHSYTGTVMLIR